MMGSNPTTGYANNPNGTISNKAAWNPKFFDEVVKAWYGTRGVPSNEQVPEIEVLFLMLNCVRAFHRLHQLSWPRGIDYFAYMLDTKFLAKYEQRNDHVAKNPEKEAWILETWRAEYFAKKMRSPGGTPEDLAQRFAREQATDNANNHCQDVESSTSAPGPDSSRTYTTDTEQDGNNQPGSTSPAVAKEMSAERQEKEPAQTVTGNEDTSTNRPAETENGNATVNEDAPSTLLTEDSDVAREGRATPEQNHSASPLPEPTVTDTPATPSSRHRAPSACSPRLPSPPSRPITHLLPPPTPPPPPSTPPPPPSSPPRRPSTPPPEQSAFKDRRDWHTAQIAWAEEHSTDSRAEKVGNDGKLGLEKVANRAVARSNRKRKTREEKEATGEVSNKRRQDSEGGARSYRDDESHRDSYRPRSDRAYHSDSYRPGR